MKRLYLQKEKEAAEQEVMMGKVKVRHAVTTGQVQVRCDNRERSMPEIATGHAESQ